MRRVLKFALLFCMLGSNAQSPVDMVYPWLDAANSRWFYFSSASRPFGMVNLSPDTELGGAWGSGYRYNTEEVKGFSHVHAWQLSGLSLMPISAEELQKTGLQKITKDYYSSFSHENETVEAGYHQVYLNRYKTNVELSSSKRVGFHRISFPKNKGNAMLVMLEGNLGPSKIISGELEQVGKNEVRGMLINQKTRRRPKDTPIFFCMQFSAPISTVSIADKTALLHFGKTPKPLLLKVGISYVSAENAANNIEKEIAHWDFDLLRKESRDEWNEYLSKIEVEGNTETARRRFYTDLWHALQGRRTISDANGMYSDFTGEKRLDKQIPIDENGTPLFNHYNSDSFWGAQWTLNTLWHLAYPKVSSEFCHSLLLYYKDGGLIPRGPSGGNYTYVMTGASSTPFIVSAYQKGIRDFDIELAYEGMKKNHLPGGIMERSGYEHLPTASGGVNEYIENGYVPYPYKLGANAFHKEGTGQTLEYAYQDWTLAQLAKALNKEKDYRYFLHRSVNYKNVFNPQSGWMHPKKKDGSFSTLFDPGAYRVGFVESNAYQGTWYVPHDVQGLASLMGGEDSLIYRLNTSFEQARKLGYTSGKKHADETKDSNREIPINYGNQPSIHTAFIFHEAGAPHLSQYWSREVIDSVYSGISPEYGYNGDEDQGLMGSLAVLMKIGLFQINGGTEEDPIYQIGSPIFDKITIHLDSEYYSGKDFIIECIENSPENKFVQELYLNGKKLDRYYLRHSELISGGQLKLIMGPNPLDVKECN